MNNLWLHYAALSMHRTELQGFHDLLTLLSREGYDILSEESEDEN